MGLERLEGELLELEANADKYKLLAETYEGEYREAEARAKAAWDRWKLAYTTAGAVRDRIEEVRARLSGKK